MTTLRHARSAAAIALGLAVAAFLWRAGWSAPPASDHFSVAYSNNQMADAVRAAEGHTLQNGRSFADNCGVIFDETNHPTGDLYGAMVAVSAGLPPVAAPIGAVAAMAGLFVAVVARRSLWSAALVAAAVVAAVWGYPSFHAFLALASEGAWATGSLFLIAAAATARRPTLPIAAAVAVAAMSSIAFVTIYAGLVAGALFAAHGVSRETWRAGAAAIVAFVGVNALRLCQTWCYTGWDWAAVQDLVFTGTGHGSSGTMATSVMFRVTTMPLADRWAALWYWFPAYVQAALSPAWSAPLLWIALLGIAAVHPASPRSAAGVAVLAGGFLSFWILAPGALNENHLHLLPRLIVLLPLGMLLVLAAGQSSPDGGAR